MSCARVRRAAGVSHLGGASRKTVPAARVWKIEAPAQVRWYRIKMYDCRLRLSLVRLRPVTVLCTGTQRRTTLKRPRKVEKSEGRYFFHYHIRVCYLYVITAQNEHRMLHRHALGLASPPQYTDETMSSSMWRLDGYRVLITGSTKVRELAREKPTRNINSTVAPINLLLKSHRSILSVLLISPMLATRTCV